MKILGLDIGGANLKGADRNGRSACLPFPVWKHPDQLAMRIAELMSRFAPFELVAATMTAELADCFATKREGVEQIVSALQSACGTTPLVIWQTGGEFVSPDDALEIPELVAAANWHALATWVGRVAPRGHSLLLDVGSTTADLIPLEDGMPNPEGRTDPERLLSGELIYFGVRRTPVCAVTSTLPFHGVNRPVAAELFATTLDAYLLIGDIPEDPDCHETANGRPATRVEARRRLARMICGDGEEVYDDACLDMARFVADCQARRLAEGVERLLSRVGGACGTVVLSGEGAFLARRALERLPLLAACERVLLEDLLGRPRSTAACAVAVAELASERVGVRHLE